MSIAWVVFFISREIQIQCAPKGVWNYIVWRNEIKVHCNCDNEGSQGTKAANLGRKSNSRICRVKNPIWTATQLGISWNRYWTYCVSCVIHTYFLGNSMFVMMQFTKYPVNFTTKFQHNLCSISNLCNMSPISLTVPALGWQLNSKWNWSLVPYQILVAKCYRKQL